MIMSNISTHEIKSFHDAKRCALNDMTSKEKRVAKDLDDNALFDIIKSENYEKSKEDCVYDRNVIDANSINEFQRKLHNY